MLEIKLHEVIDAESQAWIYEWFGMNKPFSLETLQQLLEDNPDEKDIKLQIHCDGGSVHEGLALYDCLRSSGRNIYCNVEGGCHSMAIVLLLAAPKAQRTAMPNSQFLIHEVQGGVSGSTTAVERYAEEMRDLQDRILDIYADRTGYDRTALAEDMAEEKMRDADYMLEHGFIGAINEYNTNNKQNMNIIEKLKNLISQAEKEDGQQQAAPAQQAEPQAEPNNVNEPAEPQAEPAQQAAVNDEQMQQLQQQVSDLNAAVDNLTAERDAAVAERDELQGQINTLTAERDSLRDQMETQQHELETLREQVTSNGVAPARSNIPAHGENTLQSAEEQKNAVRDALSKQKKKK